MIMVQLSVPVKTCKNCGEIFVTGYHASVGIQFWITAFTILGGIIYWAIRGKGERCPKCRGREFDIDHKTLET